MKTHKTGGRVLCGLLAIMLVFLGIGASAEVAAKSLLDGAYATPEVEAIVDEFIAAHEETTAGAALAVVHGQEVLLERYVGFSNLSENTPVDAESVFEWGSVTKLLVWSSAMQLVEQGELSLQEDIRSYLPEGFLRRLAYDDPITMLHLMHHSGGWEESLIGIFMPANAAQPSLEEALRQAEPRQVRRPGEAVSYSNFGVALAGYIVERIAGQPFYAYVQEHIFAPLGMEHTALHPLLEDNAWVKAQRQSAEAYSTGSGKSPVANHYAIPLYPAGMATGTLADFVRFAQALLPQDGASTPLFQNPGTLQEMLSTTLYYGDSDIARNSHGFWSIYFEQPMLGHGGNTAGFSSYLLIHPESGYGMVVMTNQPGEGVFNSELPTALFGAYAPASGGEPLPDTTTMRGVYRSSRVTGVGASRLYSLMVTIPLLSGNGDMLKASILGNDLGGMLVLRETAPYVFVEESSEPMLYAPIYAASTEDGGTKLEMPYMEFLPMSTGQAALEYLSVLLLALAVLYSLLMLLYSLCRFLTRRIKRSDKVLPSFEKFHLLQCLAVVLAFLSICAVALLLMTYGGRVAIGICLGLTVLFALCSIAYLVLYFTGRKRRRDDGKAAHIRYALTAAAAVILPLFVAYWQLFRF